MKASRSYFLAVESEKNWELDRDNNFRFLGISNKRVKVATGIRKGDIIFLYVSKPKSAVSDARVATEDGTYNEPLAKEYESPFSLAIKTEAFVTPSTDHWIPYRELWSKLSFLGNPPKAFAMHNSFRRLSHADAKVLLQELRSRARKKPVASG